MTIEFVIRCDDGTRIVCGRTDALRRFEWTIPATDAPLVDRATGAHVRGFSYVPTLADTPVIGDAKHCRNCGQAVHVTSTRCPQCGKASFQTAEQRSSKA